MKLPLIIIAIVLSVILERSLLPLLGIGGASLSAIGIIVAVFALGGLMEEGLVVAVVGGLLLDLASGGPFGATTASFGLVWLLFFVTSRFRLVVPQIVIVATAMAATGLLVVIPELLHGGTFLLLVASMFLHALAGTLLFPLLHRFLPRPEVI